MDEQTRRRLYREAQKEPGTLSRKQKEEAVAKLEEADRDWLRAIPAREQHVVAEILARFPGTTIE